MKRLELKRIDFKVLNFKIDRGSGRGLTIFLQMLRGWKRSARGLGIPGNGCLGTPTVMRMILPFASVKNRSTDVVGLKVGAIAPSPSSRLSPVVRTSILPSGNRSISYADSLPLPPKPRSNEPSALRRATYLIVGFSTFSTMTTVDPGLSVRDFCPRILANQPEFTRIRADSRAEIFFQCVIRVDSVFRNNKAIRCNFQNPTEGPSPSTESSASTGRRRLELGYLRDCRKTE